MISVFSNAELLTAFATLAGVFVAAGGFLLAWWQLRLGARHALASFEDQINRKYREIAREIPVVVFFGEELSEEQYDLAFPALFRYIDLSSEQVFLRQIGRVRKSTWEFWRDGIASNLERHAFTKAWEQIKEKADPSFSELRALEASGFEADPYAPWWIPWREFEG